MSRPGSIAGVAVISLVAACASLAADRALVVGVEHYRDARVPETAGCIEDARKTASFICDRYAFAPSAVRILVDEQATTARILSQFRDWLITGTQPGDRVFFSYAGHGSQLPDDKGGYESTIAPYDVDPWAGANEIRASVFESLISQLSGRRAVCLFDSCHSGGIARGIPKLSRFPRGGGARYLPRPDQFRALFGGDASAPRSTGAGYVIVRGEASRDLVGDEPFVKSSHLGALNGVVLIEAAGADQRAYPLEVQGSYRGALSYVFTESQQQSLPPLRVLRDLIAGKIKELQRNGRLDGNQAPRIKVVSRVPLDDYPLFATWEQAPAVALVNPLSTIKLGIRGRDGRTTYNYGQALCYEITTDTPGYLYLIDFSENNVATLLFPNKDDLDNRVGAGTLSLLRRKDQEIIVGEPPGRDVVVALLSGAPLNELGGQEVIQTHLRKADDLFATYAWSEVFERVNLAALSQALEEAGTRGQVVRKAGNGVGVTSWQAATTVIETRP